MAITINNVRLSYCNLFQAKPPYNNPNGDPKFSCTILVPKTNTEAKTAIDAANRRSSRACPSPGAACGRLSPTSASMTATA